MRAGLRTIARWLAVLVAAAGVLVACGGGDDVQVVERVVETPAQTVILSGTGEPEDTLGSDGQFYLDASALLLYGPRAQGQWPRPARSISGAPGMDGQDGQDGQDGVDGADGADGARILAGTSAPSAGTGRDGDYYLDRSVSVLYGPKTAGAWPAVGLSLVGLTGPAGSDGQDGAPGPQGPAGPAGPASVDLHWNIASNSTFGNGSYYLWPQGPNANARNPVLLPRVCSVARLRVATLGLPSANGVYTFTVQHTPGPDLSVGATTDTALSCVIDSATRHCDTGDRAVAFGAGDAVEVRLVGNEAITNMTTPGSWGIAFTCQ
jgi:hypothetical protein